MHRDRCSRSCWRSSSLYIRSRSLEFSCLPTGYAVPHPSLPTLPFNLEQPEQQQERTTTSLPPTPREKPVLAPVSQRICLQFPPSVAPRTFPGHELHASHIVLVQAETSGKVKALGVGQAGGEYVPHSLREGTLWGEDPGRQSRGVLKLELWAVI